ncbi:Virulence protein RhuM family protein [Fibrobacter sp. UWB16]|uniref:virulence RhuM family protein n=1 Tax=Fibrobacter sp. UWB16 TaxID=1945874 RepID=UPI000BD0C907|nr:RhuM family protein [Fibrobacter sp. UWB16]SOD11198.1 Virulence protein RhuM family protein [Fibrobacter sp. UWB16]
MNKKNLSLDGEIIMYQPEGAIQLPVRVENETVWLTIDQMALLFGKSRSTINEHILNALSEGEILKNESVRKIGNSDFSTKPTNFYNLDVIISVGYRVKSIQGTQFRRWANQVLKEHLLKGYSVNQRLISQENKLENLDSRVVNLEKQVDFFVKANLPPSEGVIPANARWSGYEFAVQLVRSAKKEIIIIDPFANDTSLSLVAKRVAGVNAVIYSARITRAMNDEVDRINRQFPTVVLRTMRDVHDRFIIVDETVYHVGASIMDLGCKMTAFSVLNLVTKEQLLALVK